MQKQTEITQPCDLLNEDGSLKTVGYCKHNLINYNRDAIKTHRWRLKEWDFYQVGNQRYMAQISFFNITVATAVSACLLDLKTGEIIEAAELSLFTKKRFLPPLNGEKPYHFIHKKGKSYMEFDVKEGSRRIYFKGKAKGKDFILDFNMDLLDDHQSIAIVTPFDNDNKRFFFTQKINCMATEGKVTFGDEVVEFSKQDTFTVLDWGRGVWPHKNYWYWGNGSTYIDGKRFGFEITWGIGNESNATETALFYDGKCHKIGVVTVTDPHDKWMEPWVFSSDDGRFNLTMTPFYDHATGFLLKPIAGMKCHQVHGLWNGTVKLDDGTELVIKDMYAFCERVDNLW